MSDRFPDVVEAVIEIPAGSRNKYEFDEHAEVFRLDRVLSSAVYYNFDYGFVEGTRADDGDHTDVMVLIAQPTFTGCRIWARPVGGLAMRDEHGDDFKVLGVALGDPLYAHVESRDDVSPHRLVEIEHFFETYKLLENKAVEVLGWRDRAAALEMLRADRARWQREHSSRAGQTAHSGGMTGPGPRAADGAVPASRALGLAAPRAGVLRHRRHPHPRRSVVDRARTWPRRPRGAWTWTGTRSRRRSPRRSARGCGIRTVRSRPPRRRRTSGSSSSTCGPWRCSGYRDLPDSFYRHLGQFFEQRAAWHVFADAHPVLEALTAAGIRRAVISNWVWVLPELLHDLQLAHHFETIVASARVGYVKPQREIFAHAIELTGVRPDRAVHVGDNPDADVAGATALGIRPVLLDRAGRYAGGLPGRPDVPVVADLYGLLPLLGVEAQPAPTSRAG